jgi:hypothetical protein
MFYFILSIKKGAETKLALIKRKQAGEIDF